MTGTIAAGLADLAVSIDAVHPDPANPRVGDVEAVKRSLEEFGQRKPIVALSTGMITAGHHIHAAAVGLGWDEVAVLFVDEDEIRGKAFALADNRSSDLGTYNNESLLDALRTVLAADEALLAAASYSSDDVDDLASYLAGPDHDTDSDPGDGDSGDKLCPNCGFPVG